MGICWILEDWAAELGVLLKNDEVGSGVLGAIIDSAGGDIFTETRKILKQGVRSFVMGCKCHFLTEWESYSS